MTPEQFIARALELHCPADQVENLVRASALLQDRQLMACSAARLCDLPNGPTAVGFGGARGGGKTHWLLTQMGVDDCQRRPGLKCLLLRKVNKSNKENLQDVSKRVFAHLPHSYNASTGVLTFQNGSSITCRHYRHESEIDALLGLEYDVIGIEEATTLTSRKYEDVKTCNRTSKPDWRPRIYSTTNPGGVGHNWYRKTFIVPWETGTESSTRFIQALVDDNKFNNPEYKNVLAEQTGWRRRSWLDGAWDFASGQFFHAFRYQVHVTAACDEDSAIEWFAGMDYGYTHYTVVLLACRDGGNNIFIQDEYVDRFRPPQHHVLQIKSLLERHRIFPPDPQVQALREAGRNRRLMGGLFKLPDGEIVSAMAPRAQRFFRCSNRKLSYIAAGGDLFARQYDGNSIASLFRSQKISVYPANTNRVQGWTEILRRLGDPDNGIKPSLFIHPRCKRLLDCLPFLQHDPDHPSDVLKVNTDEEGLGGDDPADALRYCVATQFPRGYSTKLHGL